MAERETGEDQSEFCPECEQMTLRRYDRRQETLVVRGDPITVDALVAICCSCGKDVEDEELDSASLTEVYAEYERHGVHPSVGADTAQGEVVGHE